MSLLYEVPPPLLVEHGIEFFRFEWLEGSTVTNHMHPAIEFLYIQQGDFNITVERRQAVARPGDLVLFPSNAIHMIEKLGAGSGSYHVLKLSPSFLFQMFHKTGIPYILPFFKSVASDAVCCFPSTAQSPRIKQQWQQMILEYEADAPSFFAMQRLLSCTFLLTFSRAYIQKDGLAARAPYELDEWSVRLISESVNYINENYAKPLRASECAAMVHLSYSYYAKLFHTVVGKSFKEYLTDFRMAKAYNMLLSSSTRISEIARACGYENVSNFIGTFKRIYSCTPGELRKGR